MKIIFKDHISIHKRPDVEHQFTTNAELRELLSKYDNWEYPAYYATIYDDVGNELMSLELNDSGRFQIFY